MYFCRMNERIKILLSEQRFLLKSLEEVNNQLLEIYSGNISDLEKEEFPVSDKASEKVLWLFNNVFNEGQRFIQIQETFNRYNGTVRPLEGIIRGLKAKGKLVIVKYNKSNKLSYWGLTEWVNNDSFKTKHTPKDILSINIETIEVIR